MGPWRRGGALGGLMDFAWLLLVALLFALAGGFVSLLDRLR